MSDVKVKYAVIELSIDKGWLVSDVWADGYDDIRSAEKERSDLLIKNNHLNPQMVQVIQYEV